MHLFFYLFPQSKLQITFPDFFLLKDFAVGLERYVLKCSTSKDKMLSHQFFFALVKEGKGSRDEAKDECLDLDLFLNILCYCPSK
jgi:hypothetical protein